MKQLLSKAMFAAMLLCFAAQSKALTYNVTVPENTQYCYCNNMYSNVGELK